MSQPADVQQIVIAHVVAWVLTVVFLALFIGDALNWFVHPLVLALLVGAGAVIRVSLFRRRQRRDTPASR